MNIKKKFLKLSIKHQILITLVLIYLVCIFSTIVAFSMYNNIIIEMQYKLKKKYFYQKYNEIIESEITFQTFLLFQYEQLIKVFNSQIYYYGISKNDLYESILNYEDDLIKDYKESTVDDYNPNALDYKTKYYFLSFSNNEFLGSNSYYILSGTLSAIDNKLNILKNFSIPFFGKREQIIKDYLLVNLVEEYLISENRSKIEYVENDSGGNYPDYYEKKINYYVNKYKNFMNSYKKGELNFMDIIYKNKYYLFQNYINETFLKEKYKNYVRKYLNDISYYFHFIDYSTSQSFLSDSGDINKVNIFQQNNIISDYINFIFFNIQTNLNLNVIPILSQNNTIMSKSLCFAFIYKQMIFRNLTSKENVFQASIMNKLFGGIRMFESNIGDCILDKKYDIESGSNAHKILNMKFNKFYSLKNSREYYLFKISDTEYGKNFFCTKYTFPDFSSLLDFKPNFFNMEQLNLYCFKTFYEPKHYLNHVLDFNYNCHYFIILILFYIWIIILFILLLKKEQLFKEIVEPINNLIKSINNLEVKEESMLKYEADDTINELFKLINDLLLGKNRQRICHDSEIGKNIIFNGTNKNINKDFNNLKLNRKLIEEMMENKDELNLKGDEILDFQINKVNFPLINNNIKKIDSRKESKLKTNNINPVNMISYTTKGEINTISLEHKIDISNQKKSFEIYKNFNTISVKPNSRKAQNEENLLEFEMIFNYKYLYDIIELVFNTDIKYDQKFVSKKSKLLYKNNIKTYNKSYKTNNTNKFSSKKVNVVEKINDSNEKYSIKETKTDIRIEDFDKSVIEAYHERNIFFLWYLEAKYFLGIEFLQNNHAKDLNNLCNLNVAYENKKQLNERLINNDIKQKKISILKKQTMK